MTAATTTIGTPRAGRREWIGLAAAAETAAIFAGIPPRNVRGSVGGDNATDLSDNPVDDGDHRQPDLRGTATPVREC